MNDPFAGAVLFAVQQNRDPLAVASANTGVALINEILLERRKELFHDGMKQLFYFLKGLVLILFS